MAMRAALALKAASAAKVMRAALTSAAMVMRATMTSTAMVMRAAMTHGNGYDSSNDKRIDDKHGNGYESSIGDAPWLPRCPQNKIWGRGVVSSIQYNVKNGSTF